MIYHITANNFSISNVKKMLKIILLKNYFATPTHCFCWSGSSVSFFMIIHTQVMGSLLTSKRQFDAISCLHKSPLARDILQYRRMDVFCVDESRTEAANAVSIMNLNPMRTTCRLVKMIILSYIEPIRRGLRKIVSCASLCMQHF